MPYISSLPITTIFTRQQGPCTAKLFITPRGGQKHAWFLHSMPLPFFFLSLIQRNSRLERMIYRASLHRCVVIAGDVASTSSNYTSVVETGVFKLSPARGQTVADSPAVHMWRVAPRGPMHNPGRLCTHIHLYQWATGKCKPKVIALDKNICLVNKYSNEGSLQVPQTDARLTGLQRDRRSGIPQGQTLKTLSHLCNMQASPLQRLRPDAPLLKLQGCKLSASLLRSTQPTSACGHHSE
ncbi:hypothetical protein XENOCAPTIV_021169 [Xenoophorus captivus]|uniref:Uncharacterized protein n=1 Tax=Xenoophorus captivus TaxID=1517983 RepID=A0ABV0QXE0_9TELE